MTEKVRSGAEVDIEAFASDLRTLADEIDEERTAVVSAVESTHKVPADDAESVVLTIEVTGGENSIFTEGYTVPFRNE